MSTYQLFRFTTRQPTQLELELIGMPLPASSLLRTAIEEAPAKELRKGQVWRIGNLERLDETGIYFAFGRERKSAIERYDAEKHEFLQELTPTAPYTHVFLDVELQVAAIAGESDLAPRTPLIAKRLAQVLSNSRIANERLVEVEEYEIRDPESFVTYLREAYAVRSFSFDFKPPNPIDVEKEIHKPLERYLREAGGDKGTTSISGAGLNTDVLERLSRSVAAQGQNAKARVVPQQGARAIEKRLQGNPVTFNDPPPGPDKSKTSLLDRARTLYRDIRGRE